MSNYIKDSLNNIHNSNITIATYPPSYTVPKVLTPTLGIKGGFIGRKEELKEIEQSLQAEGSLVLLNGIGGIGKSSLAAYYLATHQDNYEHYGFIPVGDGLKEGFISALSASLKLNSDSGIDSAFNEALIKLHNLEGEKLLVIDDLHGAQELELLCSLESSGYKLLFTSRRGFKNLKLYRVSGLKPEDARELFLKFHTSQELEKIDKILKYLDYHTLFIELIAKTIEENGYSLDEIINKFESGELAKIEYIDEEKGEKQRINHNLQELFSLQELSKEYRELLQKIAILPSIEIDEEFLLKVIQSKKGKLNFLVNRGWLIGGEGTYKLNQIIKEFILSNHLPSFEIVQPQIEFFYEIITHSNIASFFKRIGYQEKLSQEFLNSLGNLLYSIGEYQKALEYYKEALSIAQAIKDKAGEGATLNNISSIYYARGDLDRALKYLEQSLEIQRAVGDKAGEGVTLNNISQIYTARGDLDRALEYLEQSLKIERAIGEKAREGATLNNISQIYKARGDLDRALEYLEQSLEIRRAVGEKAGEGATLNNISQRYDARGDLNRALEYLEQSLEIRRDIGDKAGEGATLNNISSIYYARGDLDRALKYLEQSLEIRRDIGEKAGEGVTLNNISQIYTARGDLDRALKYLEQSLEIRRDIGDKAGEGASLFNLGHIYILKSELEKAMAFWVEAYKIAKEIELAELLEALANLAKQLDLGEGLEVWERLALAQE
jgi:tetratricopeptide (TPR) repeat protein